MEVLKKVIKTLVFIPTDCAFNVDSSFAILVVAFYFLGMQYNAFHESTKLQNYNYDINFI